MDQAFSLDKLRQNFHSYIMSAEDIDDSYAYVFFGIIEFIIAKEHIALEELLEDRNKRTYKNKQQEKQYLRAREQLFLSINQFLNLEDVVLAQQVILFLFDELFIKSELKSEFIEELVLLVDFIELEVKSYPLETNKSALVEINKSSTEARSLNKELFQLFGSLDTSKVEENTDSIVEIAFKLTHSVFYQAHLLSSIKLNHLR